MKVLTKNRAKQELFSMKFLQKIRITKLKQNLLVLIKNLCKAYKLIRNVLNILLLQRTFLTVFSTVLAIFVSDIFGISCFFGSSGDACSLYFVSSDFPVAGNNLSSFQILMLRQLFSQRVMQSTATVSHNIFETSFM